MHIIPSDLKEWLIALSLTASLAGTFLVKPAINEGRLAFIEKTVAYRTSTVNQIPVLQNDVTWIKKTVDRIEDKLDTLVHK